MSKTDRQKILLTVICIMLIPLLEYLFFGNVIGTSACLGDTCDGRLTALITEHWYQFFTGKDTLTEVNGIFYPAENVLSYSDIMLGVGLIHSLLRLVGIEIFTAYKYSLIIIHFAGSIGLFCYLRFLKKINPIPAFLGVVCFSYSHVLLTQSVNTQLICVSALVFELIFIHFLIHSKSRVVRYINLVLTALFMALQFYTAYYIAFMGALQIAIIAIVFIVAMLIKNREYLISLLKRWHEFLLCLVLFASAMIPFVMLYLPTFNDREGLSYSEVYVTQLSDLFYNGFYKISDTVITKYNDNYVLLEQPEFYPIVSSIAVAVMLIACFFIYLKKRKEEGYEKKNAIAPLFISVVIIFFIGLDINGFSVWEAIYNFIPGAQVLRAAMRWHLVITLPLSILFAFCGDYIYNAFPGKGKYVSGALLIILTALVWYDNFNPAGAVSAYNTDDSERFIKYVKSPPEDCKIFYIRNGDKDLGNEYIYRAAALIPPNNKIDIDAMYLSAYYNLKTLNGYSGGVPKGWDIKSMGSYDTDEMAINWLRINGIPIGNVYVYDMTDNTWEKAEY